MRKPLQLALLALIVVFAAAAGVLFFKYRETSANLTATRASEDAAQVRYDRTIEAIAEIQDSLNAITLSDTTVPLRSGNLEAEQKLTAQDGRDALERIALLRAGIVRSKQRIQQLEHSMKVSGIKLAGLQRMITNLKFSVSEKEAIVAELTGHVNALQTQVAGLETEVKQTQNTVRDREQSIEEKRQELATVYYVVGNKKELAASGVIVAKGGVLGLGRTLAPTGRIDESRFTALDTDQETVVRTQSPKARVVSPQPSSSYELKLVGGWMELHILDPKEFRKTKQLVIVTA